MAQSYLPQQTRTHPGVDQYTNDRGSLFPFGGDYHHLSGFLNKTLAKVQKVMIARLSNKMMVAPFPNKTTWF